MTGRERIMTAMDVREGDCLPVRSRRTASPDGWDARFGFYWYNDEELFRFADEDFRRKARSLADAGIAIVITFSCTHFRFSMYEHWDLITRCLRRIVETCHEVGIRVVEHHSSHLTFDPLDEEDWDYFDRILTKRGSAIGSWPGIRDFVTDNFTREFRQIDGRTGRWARSCYHGYALCFNNPGYRKVYFDYLEALYRETGVDGIMTDDVQYFGDWQACTCSWCRDLFARATGHEIPAPAQWAAFYGDYDNPVYVAWERFRRDSTERFQRDVTRHYQALGLDLLRPNYVSQTLSSNYTAYPFDSCGDLWDWVFQENCFSTVIRYSWPYWFSESVHRYAMGRKNGVPSMSMFYPDRYDTYYFTWSLARLFGQMGLFTPEGTDIAHVERRFRDFERRYAHLVRNPVKLPDFAVYFPFDSWQYTDPAKSSSIELFKAFTQGALFNGLVPDMVYAEEEFERFDVIVLLDVKMLSDAVLEKLSRYLRGGGRLLVFGVPGERDETGAPRPVRRIEEALGIDLSGRAAGDGGAAGDCTSAGDYRHGGDGTGQRHPSGRAFPVDPPGRGGVFFTRDLPFADDRYDGVDADRWLREEARVAAPPALAEVMSRNQGAMLRALIGERCVIRDKDPDALLLVQTYHADEGRHLVVHVLDATRTFPADGGTVGHRDPVVNFGQASPAANRPIVLTLRDDSSCAPPTARFITPERDGETPLACTRAKGSLAVQIPEGLFSGYGMVVIDRAPA